VVGFGREVPGAASARGTGRADYASKIHLAVVPVYYHNYTLGQLFASQLQETIAAAQQRDPFTAVLYQDPKVGELLKTKIFAPGARYRWDELIKAVTGKPLGPRPSLAGSRRGSNRSKVAAVGTGLLLLRSEAGQAGRGLRQGFLHAPEPLHTWVPEQSSSGSVLSRTLPQVPSAPPVFHPRHARHP